MTVPDVIEFSLPHLPKAPLSAWTFLHRLPRHGFFLGSGAGTERDHTVYMSVEEPVALVQRFSDLTARGYSPGPRFVGVLGFDAGREFDDGVRRLKSRPNPLVTPTTLFGDYRSVLKIDLKAGVATLFVHGDERRALAVKNRVDSALRAAEAAEKNSEGRYRGKPSEFFPAASRFRYPSLAQFTAMVRQAKEAIRRGDIYQANLSLRFEGDFEGSAVDLYRRLCSVNPSPYACLIKQDNSWIVSNSPELLVEIKGREVRTRPIAGTRPRGTTARRDNALRGQLLLSPKERAEHIMLVDLERNDVGRVCEAGSVQVSERFHVERYSHVMHIVSQVNGRLSAGKSAADAVRALFPGGTITGCPKIKSIEVIEELEGVSRGPFYGSAGFFSWNGDATFNILIRTALLQNKKLYVQAGAGIVADSRPEKEYREVQAKARAILEAVASLNQRRNVEPALPPAAVLL